MTLIVNLTSRDYALSLSDRRLATIGGNYNDKAPKGLLLSFDDARLAVAFTGLGSVGRNAEFDTFTWLIDTIIALAPPDYSFESVLTRLAGKATNVFKTNGLVRKVTPQQQRLTISFAGFKYGGDGLARPVQAIVSNFEDGVGTLRASAAEEFSISLVDHSDPRHAIVGVYGMGPAVPYAQRKALADLAADGAMVEDLEQKIRRIHYEAADHPASRDLIGRDGSLVIVPARRDRMGIGVKVKAEPDPPGTIDLDGPWFVDATSAGIGTPALGGFSITYPPGSEIVATAPLANRDVKLKRRRKRRPRS